MVGEKLSRVMVFLMTHRDTVQSDFIPLAQLDMGMLPTKGDIIDVADYILPEIRSTTFCYRDQLIRVDAVYISYQNDDDGKREIVNICGTAVARPHFV